jgi:uncharacterized protein
MATAYFLDSSGLVKRYVQETGTAWVRVVTRHSKSTHIHIARITAVEVTAAVARRRKERTVTSRQASSILARFRKHLAGRYIILEITPALADAAMTLANKHTLRAYDAVQLAAAIIANKDWTDAGWGHSWGQDGGRRIGSPTTDHGRPGRCRRSGPAAVAPRRPDGRGPVGLGSPEPDPRPIDGRPASRLG